MHTLVSFSHHITWHTKNWCWIGMGFTMWEVMFSFFNCTMKETRSSFWCFVNSCINSNVVEIFHLQRSKHKKSWLVQLSIGAKRKINDLLKYFSIDKNGLSTKVDVKIIPFGSYDCLIDMDWLEKHHVVLDRYNKTITCFDEEG